jgi:hypothetical protein
LNRYDHQGLSIKTGIAMVQNELPGGAKMAEGYPRKYWWSVLIVVPVAVAMVQILPSIWGKSGGGQSKATFDLQGAEFRVTMIEGQVIRSRSTRDRTNATSRMRFSAR